MRAPVVAVRGRRADDDAGRLLVRRLVVMLAVVVALSGATAGPAAAQVENIDAGFSDEVIRGLGYPELPIRVGPEGIEAPATVAAGFHLVSFTAPAPYVGYLDFMPPPAGLGEEEATELALAAARDDLAQEGWVYAGGTNTFDPGETRWFVIDLAPGEYRVAASYYLPEQGSEEVMRLAPLTVTAAGTAAASPVGSPAASPGATPVAGEPPATVTLEMTDELRYVVTPDPVPAGPQVWEITNTGERAAHHVVMLRLPEGVTSEQIVAELSSLMAGTPPAGEPLLARSVGVGYAALQSGGQTTWVGFDLEPATYAVICFIIDPATGRPHVIDGMATVFTAA